MICRLKELRPNIYSTEITKRGGKASFASLAATILWTLAILIPILLPRELLLADDKPEPSAPVALLDTTKNKSWEISEKDGQAVFTGNAKSDPPTLIMQRDAFAHTKTVLQITTDAKSCLLTSGTGSIELTLAPGRANEITCNNASDIPAISLNGRELPEFQGKWIQITRKSESSLVIVSMVDATYANVKFKSGTALEPPPQDMRRVAATKPAPTIVRIAAMDQTRTQMLERVRKSVFEISRNDRVSGTGFLLTSDGFAATNSHVVLGGASAVGVFRDQKGNDPDKPQEIPLELWSINREVDLAIVKLKPGASSKILETLTPLEIENATPKDGEEVCALGFPEMGYTVTRGIVSGSRRFSELPLRVQKILGDYSLDSMWIQTDCTINHGNSGGPLLDAHGRVVCINTWSWLKDNNVYFAVSATHLKELLDKRSAQPITFAGANKQYDGIALPHQAFPRIVIAPDSGPITVASKANILYDASLCSKCSGSGHISYEVQVGHKTFGGMTTPVYETRQSVCPQCRGAMYISNPTAAERVFPQLVESLARANSNAKDYQKGLDTAVPEIRRLSEVTPETFDSFGQACLRAISGTGSKSKPGACFVALGLNIIDFKIPGEDGVHAVRIYQNYRRGARWTDRYTLVVFSKPRIVDAVKDEFVVVGGIYAGSTIGPNGDLIPFVQDGFIVGIGGSSRYVQMGTSVESPR